ncbi:MAG: DNA primase [Minisyncoccota bacterium]
MSQVTEHIKARLSIADVVGGYLALERAGGNLKGRCPFHHERTASFFVSPARESYHCFGCDRGGDIFTFVQEIEGLDFRGALKILAERAGVELTPINPREVTEREEVLAALEDAARHFEAELQNAAPIESYLFERGVTKETIRAFRIGYARDEWRNLRDALRSKGHTDRSLERAGLVIKTDKGYYDRFRGRVMFPILDGSGRVIAFSGRIMPGAATAETKAKYVNSPETTVYHKSQALYAFDKAKPHIRQIGAVVLVEGQMDAVMSHQAGVGNTVAVSGTALTEEHLTLLKRLTEKIIFAFDDDTAGIAASRRGVDMALRLGFDVRAAAISNGKDPADVAREHPEAWKDAVAHAQHVIDFYVRAICSHEDDVRIQKVKVGEIILPYIAALENHMDRAHFIAMIAHTLGMREEPLWDELKKYDAKNQQLRPHVLSGKTPTVFSRKDRIARRIAGIIFWQENVTDSTVDARAIRERAEKLDDTTVRALLEVGGDTLRDLAFEAEVYYAESNLGDATEELFTNFEIESVQDRLVEHMERLKAAEHAGKTDQIPILLTECRDLSLKLNHLKKNQSLLSS